MGAIDNLFKKFTLPQWRDALYWWLIVSMDYTSADDSRGDNYLAELHLYLQKAIEAAHLIHIWNMNKWPKLYP